jgi:ABC-type Fe3+ transport system permease subunit
MTGRKSALGDPVQFLIVAVVLSACGGLVAYPIAMLIGHSFVDGSGHFSVTAFELMLSDTGIKAAAVNSLFFIAYVTAGCLAVGVPLAWLVARTDVPAKLCIRGAIAVAFIIPSFINVIAWIFLAAPNSGYLNKLLVTALGLTAPPFNIFSFGGLVFIETAHLVAGRGLIGAIVMVGYGFPSIILGVGVLLGYINVLYGTLTIILIAYVARHLPIAFVFVRSLVKQVSPELEEAARILGAGRLRSLVDITYPVLRPAAFIAWLLIFSLCLREQPMSAILTQSGTEVMSTMVLQFIEDGSIEVAAAISVLIVVVSMVTIAVARIFAPREILEMR